MNKELRNEIKNVKIELEIIKRKTNRPVKPYETPKKRVLSKYKKDQSYHSTENSNNQTLKIDN